MQHRLQQVWHWRCVISAVADTVNQCWRCWCSAFHATTGSARTDAGEETPACALVSCGGHESRQTIAPLRSFACAGSASTGEGGSKGDETYECTHAGPSDPCRTGSGKCCTGTNCLLARISRNQAASHKAHAPSFLHSMLVHVGASADATVPAELPRDMDASGLPHGLPCGCPNACAAGRLWSAAAGGSKSVRDVAMERTEGTGAVCTVAAVAVGTARGSAAADACAVAAAAGAGATWSRRPSSCD